MKLNLGCGDKTFEGWINVDAYAPEADLQADLRGLHYEEGTIEQIFISHVIEHFTMADGVMLLHRFYKWLTPGGYVHIETPDREKCARLMRSNKTRVRLEGARGLLGGRSIHKEEWNTYVLSWLARGCPNESIPEPWTNLPGEEHLHVWSALELMRTMKEIGYITQVARLTLHGRRSHRDSAIRGYKSESKQSLSG